MKHRDEYQNFFLKSNAGKDFMTWLNEQSANAISRAKKQPETARDEIALVRGLDMVKEHVDIMCLERGKIRE